MKVKTICVRCIYWYYGRNDQILCGCPGADISNYITGDKYALAINDNGDCKYFAEGTGIRTRIGNTLAETYWYVRDDEAGLSRLRQICENLMSKYLPLGNYTYEKEDVLSVLDVVIGKLGALKTDPLR